MVSDTSIVRLEEDEEEERKMEYSVESSVMMVLPPDPPKVVLLDLFAAKQEEDKQMTGTVIESVPEPESDIDESVVEEMPVSGREPVLES